MSEPFVFDSRDIRYKDPFGAALCGQTVTLHCRPLTEDALVSGILILYHEFADTVEKVPLEPIGTEGERTVFRAVFSAPKEGELTWYHFCFYQKDGKEYILDRTGWRDDGHWEPWQLTTYAESHTPQWFGDGVTYQIFPDRFCRLDLPDPEGMIGNRVLHAS